jgi:hypothetical protein
MMHGQTNIKCVKCNLFKSDLFKNNVLLFLYRPHCENMNIFSDFLVYVNIIVHTKLNTKEAYPDIYSIRHVYDVIST